MGPRNKIWIALTLIAATAAVFGRIVGHDFVSWDDPLHLWNNPHLNPPTTAGLCELWRAPYAGEYVPATYTLFALEAWLGQALDAGRASPFSPAIFHIGSLTLHLLCVLGVFLLLRRLVRHDAAAALGALLFGLHPLQVESVAWVSETRGLLAALFSIIALGMYLRFAEDRGAKVGGIQTNGRNATESVPYSAAKGRDRMVWYAAATMALVLALLAKPSAVATPLLAVVLDRWLLGRRWREIGLALAPWLLLAVLLATLTKTQQPTAELLDTPPLWARPLVAGDALAFYLAKLAWPAGLTIHYDRSPRAVLATWPGYVSWLLPCGLVALLACTRRRGPWLAAAGLFVAGVLPVLGFVPFTFQKYATVADRYVYLAMLGPALALAGWLARGWTGGWMGARRAAAAGLVLAIWGALSFVQAGHWRNNAALYARALAVNPASALAHHNLGAQLLEAGDVEGAIDRLDQALALDPLDPESWFSRGAARERQGRLDEALADHTRALEINPGFVKSWHNRAGVLARLGRPREAVLDYTQALALDKNLLAAVVNRGALLHQLGRYEQALADQDRAIELAPSRAELHDNRGQTLARIGRQEQAIADFTRAIELAPDVPESYVRRGLARRELGRHEQALADIRQAAATFQERAWRLARDGQVEAARADLERMQQLGVSPDPELDRLLHSP